MPETVKFQTNVPVVGRLKFPDGLPCQSQYSGDQVRYTLEDDRAIYVSPAVADKIKEAGITRGTPFSITKQEQVSGNRKRIVWVVENKETGEDHTPEAAPPKVTAPEAPSKSPAQQVNGNGNGNGHAPAMPTAAPVTVFDFIRENLVRCGKAAVDAVAAVEAYATEKNLEVQFREPQIQDIWISAFIEVNKNGGRR